MRLRFFSKFRLSPRAQRRLERIGATTRNAITYPVRLVFAFIKAIAGTLATWWESRNLRFLLQGLPALVLGIGILVLGAVILFQDRSVLANDYQRQGYKSLNEAELAVRSSKDGKAAVAMAQTCYKRLSHLQPDKDENSFLMARAYDLQRQPQAADSILRNLAPSDRTKYGPAHLAMARRLLAVPRPTPVLLQAAEQHLLRAVHWKGEPTTSEAHAVLFDLYRLTNRPTEAEQHLVAAVERIGDRRPELRLRLAAWYQTQGKKELAVRHAQQAAKSFRDRLDDNLDDHPARGGLIDCLMFTGDYAGAKLLCQQGAALVPNTPLANQYTLTLVRVLTTWYDALTADPKSSPEERFAKLEEVMHRYPDDPNLLQRLIVFTRQTGQVAEKAKKHFQELIDTGKPSATAHMVLGMDEWAQGHEADARHHWEKAFELSQGAPLVANNLAWVLAFHPPEDPSRALGIIDAALEKMDDPRFHGTKGHILAKLDRDKEALAELEKAVTAYANDPKLFDKLAELCGKVGRTGDAARYKRRAEELKKASPGAGAGPSAGPPKVPSADTKGPAATPDQKAPPPSNPKP